ncbi:MAG: hypothetical protein JXB35_13830 [Anaerolineae bacterium]|nr:hypothetical protein [Anaerolineae bacterium]
MINACKRVQRLLALRPEAWGEAERLVVSRHLAGCAECARIRDIYREQDRLICALPAVSLTAAQRAHVLGEVQSRSRRIMPGLKVGLAFLGAAMILTALAIISVVGNALRPPLTPTASAVTAMVTLPSSMQWAVRATPVAPPVTPTTTPGVTAPPPPELESPVLRFDR